MVKRTCVMVLSSSQYFPAPFLDTVKPEDIRESYLIWALDRWPGKRNQNQLDKEDAADRNELNELKT